MENYFKEDLKPFNKLIGVLKEELEKSRDYKIDEILEETIERLEERKKEFLWELEEDYRSAEINRANFA